MADDIEKMARRAVQFAPFCGPSPEGNRWSDLCLLRGGGEPLNVDGEAIMFAVQRGWLRAEHLAEPCRIIHEADGPWPLMWRYHAVEGQP